MDTLKKYREIIKHSLSEIAMIPYAYGDLEKRVMFDEETDNYAVITQVWEHNGRRAHGCLVHIEIRDGKVWIQRDGTEDGVAAAFLDSGIPKDKIVLAFHSPARRELSGFATS